MFLFPASITYQHGPIEYKYNILEKPRESKDLKRKTLNNSILLASECNFQGSDYKGL